MEVQGIIRKIEDTQKIKETFQKRELILTTEEQYPQHLKIEFVQDKTSLLDNYKEGDKVKVGINLRGREWKSPQGEIKYFNSINGWRIEQDGGGASTPSSSNGAPKKEEGPMPDMPPMADEDDDLPF